MGQGTPGGPDDSSSGCARPAKLTVLLEDYRRGLAIDHSEATVRAYVGDIRGFVAYATRSAVLSSAGSTTNTDGDATARSAPRGGVDRAPVDAKVIAEAVDPSAPSPAKRIPVDAGRTADARDPGGATDPAITTRAIRGWLAARPAARSTTARRLSSIASFTAWLLRAGVLDHDPTEPLVAPRVVRTLPTVLRADQMVDVLATAAGEAGDGDPVALRDHAIVELLYATGMRVSELCGIDIDDLDFDRSVVRVLGKGDKQRVVPFGRPAEAAVRSWLASGRPVLAGPRSGPAVFLGVRGARLDQRQARSAVHRVVAADPELPSVAPHGLRHTAATHVLDGGADLRVVQELLGHASMATTQIYTHISMQRLRAAHDRAHPRAE